jgi:uncharacterized protein with FMN-binding domain
VKRIVFWFLGTASVVVLMFGYHTSTSGPESATAPINGSSVNSNPAPTPSAGAGSGDNGSSNGSGSSNAGTVTGQVASTQWGPVQVQLTVQGGKITDVTVLQYPNGNRRDAEINDYALPILIDETKQAQSAQIGMVSGATVTSDGYIRSLQSALDQVK